MHISASRQSRQIHPTWVSAINFWAWNMIGPLSTTYAGDMKLSSTAAWQSGGHPDPGRVAGPDCGRCAH